MQAHVKYSSFSADSQDWDNLARISLETVQPGTYLCAMLTPKLSTKASVPPQWPAPPQSCQVLNNLQIPWGISQISIRTLFHILVWLLEPRDDASWYNLTAQTLPVKRLPIMDHFRGQGTQTSTYYISYCQWTVETLPTFSLLGKGHVFSKHPLQVADNWAEKV